MLIAHVEQYEVGSGAELRTADVVLPAQYVHTRLLLPGIKHAHQSADRVVQSHTHVS